MNWSALWRRRPFPPSLVIAIKTGPSAAHWDDARRYLLSAVDDCIADHRIAPQTLTGLSEYYSGCHVLDLIATVVMYQAMAIVTRSFEIPIDEEKPSFSVETFKLG